MKKAPLTTVRETSPMKHENVAPFHDDVHHEGDDNDELDDEDDSSVSQSSSYISEPADSADEDAAYYRYLQRKRDRYLAGAKEDAEALQREKEIAVEGACSLLEAEVRNGNSVPIGPLEGGRWELYSTEYLSHYFVEEHLGKTLRFGKAQSDVTDIPRLACGSGQVSAELHIYPEGHLDIYPFDHPLHASLRPVIVESLQDCDIELVFLGHGYLKLRLRLDALIKAKSPTQHVCEPKMIEFSGIWVSDEEWKKRRQESFRSHRPPSPKDSVASRLCGWD